MGAWWEVGSDEMARQKDFRLSVLGPATHQFRLHQLQNCCRVRAPLAYHSALIAQNEQRCLLALQLDSKG